MKRSETSPVFMEALFPLIMTVIAFVLFIVVYYFLTTWSINPRYIGNLIFAVPFVCFGIITFFAAAGKIEAGFSAVITGVLIFALGAVMLFAFGYRVINDSTTGTTDTAKYERVLKLTGHPGNPLTKYYPDKIPDNAENVLFSYNPAIGQGGENIELKFNTDSDSTDEYIALFSRLAKWKGKSGSSEAEKNGIFSADFHVFGYTDLPEDFTIYLLYGKPYRPGDWNHGELTLAAISKQRNEIIFHAEDW